MVLLRNGSALFLQAFVFIVSVILNIFIENEHYGTDILKEGESELSLKCDQYPNKEKRTLMQGVNMHRKRCDLNAA